MRPHPFYLVDSNSRRLRRCATHHAGVLLLTSVASAVAVTDHNGLVLSVLAETPGSRWKVAAIDKRNCKRRKHLGLEPLLALGGSQQRSRTVGGFWFRARRKAA